MVKRSEDEVLQDFEQRARAILGTNSSEDATDGRVAIRLRNREKVIDALIELVTEGKPGTIDEIVERSGVARRTIFRHFTDLSDLRLAAMRSVMSLSAPLAALTDPGIGPLDARIESFVDARLRTLAVMHPFRSGVNSRLSELDAVKAGLKATTDMMTTQISNHFAEELSALPSAHVEHVVEAVYVLISYESYDIFVTQLERSVETVRATWIRAVTSLLTA